MFLIWETSFIHTLVKANAFSKKFNNLATAKDREILNKERVLGFTAPNCPTRFWSKKDKVLHVITHPDREESVFN